MSTNVTPDAPEWFRTAVETEPELSSIPVHGARIAYRCWGEPGAPGLILVHGGAAHSGWWDHIAPRYSADRRVVALDLSGHGDSGWRDTYSLGTWADEVIAVATAAEAITDAVLVGHSLGGLVGIRTSIVHPGLADHLVLVDSRILDAAMLDEIQSNQPEEGIPRGSKHYPSLEAALERFRLVPDHASLDYARNHVARQSVVRDDDGWRWKFDRGFADELTDLPSHPPSSCRLSIVYGEHGVVTPAMIDMVTAGLDEPARVVVELAGAGHHIPLEQPLALMEVIDDVLRA
ncbi:alpha/beta fold hydrolase [Gordonia rubripertincta]|uniref:alpha/beta fold hydrolase n=1 Tax=Gordonia rubripertincta TaxID=36822 RepID=UPI000B8D96D4|nr:alpha/beta hydrolase [Gordonia rubripertincta]ASR01625.1 Sigma factor SigB regulation protein RsbQ [Gordonia rubripertincta]